MLVEPGQADDGDGHDGVYEGCQDGMVGLGQRYDGYGHNEVFQGCHYGVV